MRADEGRKGALMSLRNAESALQRDIKSKSFLCVRETYESVKDNWNSLSAREDLHVFERWVELLLMELAAKMSVRIMDSAVTLISDQR